jgi:hypothetical protein
MAADDRCRPLTVNVRTPHVDWLLVYSNPFADTWQSGPRPGALCDKLPSVKQRRKPLPETKKKMRPISRSTFTDLLNKAIKTPSVKPSAK